MGTKIKLLKVMLIIEHTSETAEADKGFEYITQQVHYTQHTVILKEKNHAEGFYFGYFFIVFF